MANNTKIQVPVDGSILLPSIIDFNLEHNYSRSFFVWANDDPIAEPHTITQGEFARASHRVAHIVRPPGKGADQDVVAIIANIDTILYVALISGIIRAGMVPFTISPRNSPAAVASLLRSTECHRVLVSRNAVSDLIIGTEKELSKDSYEISFEDVPLLSNVYPKLAKETSNDPFDPYPVSDNPPAMDDVCLYMHSSGSTSLPRAIAQTHRIILQWQSFPRITEVSAYDPPLRFAAYVLPPFHAVGITAHFFEPLFVVNAVSVFPPTSYENPGAGPIVPNNSAFLFHATRSKANAIVVVPSFLEDWMENDASIDWLKSLEIVMVVAAPLARKKGNALVAAGVKIATEYGATEIGGSVHLFPRKQDLLDGDWDWVRFSQRVNPRWVPQGDGLFELQMLTTKIHQVATENLEDVKGFATKDLFEKHPTKPDLFRIVGRIDDVIVLSAGEKVVPGSMEKSICLCPDIKSAVIFGAGRPQVGLLIDPKPGGVTGLSGVATVEAYKDMIWPFIEKAHSNAPGFARVFREMIILTEPSRPLPYTAKGTVVRKMAVALYAKEIDEVYNHRDPNAVTAGMSQRVSPPKSWYGHDLLQWLSEQASEVQSGKIFDLQVDLFAQGFDSLGALFLRNRIFGAMSASALDVVRTNAENVTQHIIYEFPILAQLSKVLSDLLRKPDVAQFKRTRDKVAAIRKQIDNYTRGMTVRDSPITATFVPENAVVLVTGTTGNIGSFLLADLLVSPFVSRVYALNRFSSTAATSRSRQQAAFRERGLDVSLLESFKCRFLETDISQDRLGLSDVVYQELLNSVTAIIHNAWRLDFNLHISSFAPNLNATRALIDFANAALCTPRIVFISSVASIQSWNKDHGPCSETLSTDPSVAVGPGYGESKYVAERILALSGLDHCSLRIGQVSGSTSNGTWPTADWVPIIIKSSIHLGCLPDMQQPIDWIPVDNVSRVILDVLFNKELLSATLNVVHPKPILWSYMINAVNDALEKNNVCPKLPLVPWAEWMSKIENLGYGQLEEDLLQSLPAIKILRFFQGFSGGAPLNDSAVSDAEVKFPEFLTDTTWKTSRTFRDMSTLTRTDIERWIHFWHLKRFF